MDNNFVILYANENSLHDRLKSLKVNLRNFFYPVLQEKSIIKTGDQAQAWVPRILPSSKEDAASSVQVLCSNIY
jgi:hypothetical protein